MRPLVSIIIPLYNAAPYIEETLDSVLASSYRPIEVVVVDDGSKDDSLRVAETYCQKHTLCRVLSQPNAGVSAARNHAIREAKGKYILPVKAVKQDVATAIEMNQVRTHVVRTHSHLSLFHRHIGRAPCIE